MEKIQFHNSATATMVVMYGTNRAPRRNRTPLSFWLTAIASMNEMTITPGTNRTVKITVLRSTSQKVSDTSSSR